MFAVMTAEITVLSLCALLCAAASLKLKISFCADQSLGSLCADLHVGKARAAKIRLFSAGNSFYGQVNARDPKKLRFVKKKKSSVSALKFLKNFSFYADEFTLNVTLKGGDYPDVFVREGAARCALALLSAFVKCPEARCSIIRSADAKGLLVNGSMTVSVGELLSSAVYALSLSRKKAPAAKA